MKVIRSFCRNCMASCGTVFEVEDGEVVRYRPDKNNAISEGFVCIKGEMAVEMLTDRGNRLLTSKRRLPDGSYEDIGSAQAITEIADKLRRIIDEHGPRAVGLFYGTFAYPKSFTVPSARAFLAALETPNLFTTLTIDSSAFFVCDGRMGMFRTGRPHIEDIDLLLLSGTNPVISHFAFYSTLPSSNQARHIKELRARGGKLIVIDPRRTETARLADIHVQPRPGFDAEIHAALIRIVLERGWHDVLFSARYLADVDALKAAVDPFTPALVAQRAGIAPETLELVAEALQAAMRPSISVGTGVTMSPHANVAVHMANALNALCGGFARAGDRVRYPGFFHKRATVEGVVPPNRTWEHEPKLRSGHGLLRGEFGSSRLIDEMTEPGEGQIRALFTVGANPAMAFGEPARMRAALSGLDLLVVLDPLMTETAQLADYVIATTTQYEAADCTRFNDSRFIKPFVQYTEPVLPPPPGTIDEWRFFHELAGKLGLDLTLPAADPRSSGLRLTHDRAWTDDDVMRWYFDQAGLSFDEIREIPGGISPDVPEGVITEPELDDGARLHLCPPDVAEELRAVSRRTEADGYAYKLVNRRIVESLNSVFRFSSVTRRRYRTNPLYMHPDDLARDRLAEGALVEVSGEHGSMRAYVKSDATMRPGTVSMTHGWGAPDTEDDPLALKGSHTSRLVSMRLEHVQAIDAMPMQSSLPVNIALLSQPEAAGIQASAHETSDERSAERIRH